MRYSTPPFDIEFDNNDLANPKLVVPDINSRFDKAMDSLIKSLIKSGSETTVISTERWCATPGGGFVEGGKFEIKNGHRIGGHAYGCITSIYYAFLNTTEVSLEVRENILRNNGYPPLSNGGEGYLY